MTTEESSQHLREATENQLPDVIEQAQRCADAIGSQFLLGIRPDGGGTFAHCDGIEYDGPFEECVPAVAQALAKRAQDIAIVSQKAVERSNRIVTMLSKARST